jgi:hypothetical protein
LLRSGLTSVAQLVGIEIAANRETTATKLE